MVYSGPLAQHVHLSDSRRAVMMVWPRNGRPCIVSNSVAAGLARRFSWIEDVVLYDGYLQLPDVRVSQVLRDKGLTKSSIAIERDYVLAQY